MSLSLRIQVLQKELDEAQDLIKRLYQHLGSNAEQDFRLWKETEKYCKENKLVGCHMEDKFICPACKTEWERTVHYKAILQSQSLINIMMGNKELVDMCGKCNHFVYKD
jgi:hypothetical protein